MSVYLDLIRVLAALVVFARHFSFRSISDGLLWQAAPFGHAAVVLFFVLSGYVIAFVTLARPRPATDYVLSRAARVLSVAVPALLLAFVSYAVCAAQGFVVPRPEGWTAVDSPLLSFGLAAVYLNEIWSLHVGVPTDGPFWSLTYEVWYYAFFAIAVFCRGAARLLLLAFGALVAGPKILFMMPIWLMGVAAWRYREALPERWAPPLGIASLLLFVALNYAMKNNAFTTMHNSWWPEEYSIFDHLAGGAFALHLLAAGRMRSVPGFSGRRLGQAVKAAASVGFSLYLYHLPILYLLAATLPGRTAEPARQLALLGLTGVMVVGLGLVTERRKHVVRGLLKGVFLRADRTTRTS